MCCICSLVSSPLAWLPHRCPAQPELCAPLEPCDRRGFLAAPQCSALRAASRRPSPGIAYSAAHAIGLAGIAGAFTGAYAWAQGRLPSRVVWLVLLAVPLAASLGSLLLSSLQGIIFAALLGLWLGRSRQALAITLAGLFLIGFLNTGKAAIRNIYWSQGASMPCNPVVLLQEWVVLSIASVGQA